MMAGGTAMNMIGTRQRDKATRRALKDYQNAVNARNAQERQQLMEQQGVLSGFAKERQGGIGRYITDLEMAERPVSDEGFAERNTGALNDIGKLTSGQQSTHAYSGSPRYNAEGMQQDITKKDNARVAEAMLADHTNRQIDERQKAAGHKMSLGDLLRQGKVTGYQQTVKLAKALRDLDWQRKSAAMQGELDEAQKKGQWLNMLGGLATQGGGMLATYGLASGMGGGAAAAGGASTGAMTGLGSPVPYDMPAGGFSGAYGGNALPLGQSGSFFQ
jgi:hypothetical protein